MSGPDSERPIRLLSPLFWAAMVFCLLCFAGAGYVTHIAFHGPAALGGHLRPR